MIFDTILENPAWQADQVVDNELLENTSLLETI